MGRPINKNPISRPAVIRHNNHWTDSDRALINEHMDRLDVVEHFLQNCGQDINLFNSKGEWVAWISPGRFVFRPGFEPGDVATEVQHWDKHESQRYIAFSNSKANHGHCTRRSGEEPVQLCKTCFTALPKTGQCDYCN